MRSLVDALLAEAARADALEAENVRLREAIATALTSLATGPAKDGYAYAVLEKATTPTEGDGDA